MRAVHVFDTKSGTDNAFYTPLCPTPHGAGLRAGWWRGLAGLRGCRCRAGVVVVALEGAKISIVPSFQAALLQEVAEQHRDLALLIGAVVIVEDQRFQLYVPGELLHPPDIPAGLVERDCDRRVPQLMGGQLQPDLGAVGLDDFVEAVRGQAGAGELRPVIAGQEQRPFPFQRLPVPRGQRLFVSRRQRLF